MRLREFDLSYIDKDLPAAYTEDLNRVSSDLRQIRITVPFRSSGSLAFAIELIAALSG